MKGKIMTDKATKKFNSIFYPGIIIMIVSLFLLAGTSYAWFTSTVEHSQNTISSGKLEVSLTLNDSTINLEPKIHSNSWIIETEDFVTLTANDSLTIKNTGTLNACITIDYEDESLQDKVISLDSGDQETYIISFSGKANIYCQSEFSHNKTL